MSFDPKALIKKSAHGLLSCMTGDHFALTRKGRVPARHWDKETDFITGDGRVLPVCRDYRFAVKKGFSNIAEAPLLLKLRAMGVLDKKEKTVADGMIGPRGLACSVDEISACLRSAVIRCPERFIAQTRQAAVPVLVPDLKEEEKRVRFFEREHKAWISLINAYGISFRPIGTRVLEIGYITGGHSILALDRLGMKASGIDNGYSGLTGRPFLAEAIRDGLGADVRLLEGDMTAFNEDVSSRTFDLVYSTSVLEHLQNLSGAFREMARMLSDNGLLVHAYNPFFSPNGGHASGVLDAPWAHARLSAEDYRRYLKELRPLEYERSKVWVSQALNPHATMARVQKDLSAAGFEILLWKEIPAPSWQLADLTPAIMADVMTVHPGVSLGDLVSQNVFFVARKAR